MPQVFQVLRCFKCMAFQVHQRKKSSKFDCKLCGEKQSIKRHYGLGTAKDGRIHVQKLNTMRGETDDQNCIQMSNELSSEEEELQEPEVCKIAQGLPQSKNINSKWSNYIEESKTVEETSNEPTYLDNAEVVLELPTKRVKHSRGYYKNNKKTEFALHRVSDGNKPSCNSQPVSEENMTTHLNIEDSDMPVTKVLSENNLKQISSTKVIPKKFVPPVVSKNSKWAGFTDDNENSEESVPNLNGTQNEHIFSLCDDSELDSILDIL